MRRSPFDDYDVQVSVEELAAPTPLWASVQSAVSNAQSLLASRWTIAELGTLLQRRAAVHVTVLALAVAVVGGGVLLANQDQDTYVPTAGITSDSLTVAARTAIVAHAVPLTSTVGDVLYTVQPGDSISSIAREVGVNEEALLAFNGFSSSDALSTGLQLRIPDLAKVAPEQLRIGDTAPHEGSPSLDAPLPPQKASPGVIVRSVQKGDTVGRLAAVFGVSESSVLASNNLKSDTVLSIGQTLVIPPINGRLVATKPGDTVASLAAAYSGTVEGIIAANKLDPHTTQVAPGQLVLVPSDPDVGAAIVKDIPTRSPATPAVTFTTTAESKPVEPPRPASSPGFSWPAPGTITTYFSGWHNGIDVANASGTPVRAVQAGRVVFSGWDNSGYGYMIRIDHGNGLQTLDGHASQLIARVGQYVGKGDVVMLMGSTGHSTGPHVHFSVFQGSGYSALNPLRYLP